MARMYHCSPVTHRQSIQENGLLTVRDQTGHGAIFLSDTQPEPTIGFDVWAVDVDTDLLSEDWTGDPEGECWWMCRTDIAPASLTRLDPVRDSARNKDGYVPPLVVYTDASYCAYSGVAGWAAVIRPGPTPGQTARSQKISGSTRAPCDNNQAELYAMEQAAAYLIDRFALAGRSVVFHVDCDEARRQFDPSPLMEAGASTVTARHTPAHRGISSPSAAMNTWADKQAKQEMRAVRDARDAKPHPGLSDPRL